MKKEAEPQILFLSTFPPRECGIATFTKDLSESIDQRFFPTLKSKICAMNSNGTNIYNYSKKVGLQIGDTEIGEYIETAKQINNNKNIKIVVIQHEYGIFGGGDYGDFLIPFLEILNKPVIVTFHSVLPDPNPHLKKVTQEIASRVDAIIVMTKKGVEILRKYYQIQTRIHVIPHGIPTTTLETQSREKKKLGLQKHKVALTFGLVGPGKGYDHVIEALPEVVKKHPELLYIIVGETHPSVRKKEGERFRNQLERRVKELKLQNNVKFYNKYIPLNEIVQYIKASDIYICPPENPNQITSGTLVYAMGCGRAIIATPFLHAKDIVTENRGILCDEFKNSENIKSAILEILENPEKRKEMERNAYHYTRHMAWPNVASSYGRVFNEIIKNTGVQFKELPKINIKHLMRLTDNFGIIQFANQTIPDINSGYTLDDNARALLACAMHFKRFNEYKQLKLIKTYLDYIKFVKNDDGKLYNFVDKNKIIQDKWSEDAHGRALWALGYLNQIKGIPKDLKSKAEHIFLETLPAASIMRSPRAIAFTIAGLFNYNKTRKSDYIKQNIKKLADILVSHYKTNSKEDWQWFEPYLTYSNSKLPEALLYTYQVTKEPHYLEIALKTLDFLISKTFRDETFIPIGQRGWYLQNQERSYFDQQPIDAGYTVQTLITAFKITKQEKYKSHSINAFQWFLGKNLINQTIYNEQTGGCHDGLGESSINLNQGAESTISYLMARLTLMDL
jgi:glycosyltransferase involved in cell wall biosynthesis